MAISKKIIGVGKPAAIHEAPENPTALLGSAGFLRLLRLPAGPARCGRGRAVPRRCGWITACNTVDEHLEKRMPPE